MRDAIVAILLDTLKGVHIDDVYRAADAIVRKLAVPRESIEVKHVKED